MLHGIHSLLRKIERRLEDHGARVEKIEKQGLCFAILLSINKCVLASFCGPCFLTER